ncbi:MAG TPA: protein translocase subunit SecD, partial [Anaeromyxobacter sp.]|nr:protein translocase subunit SecD [Anaeromyxobacter sp.]
LQGGILLDMGVDVDRAVKAKVTRRADAIAEQLKEKNVAFDSAGTAEGGLRVEVKAADAGAVQSTVLGTFQDMTASRAQGGVQFAFKDKVIQDFREKAVEQAEKVIRNRVDTWGVSEPDIKRKANSQIQIQLPGRQDPDEAKQLLGRTAQLEFKIVDDDSNALDQVQPKLPRCESNRAGLVLPLPATGCWTLERAEIPSGEVARTEVVAPTRNDLQKVIGEKLEPLIDLTKNIIGVGEVQVPNQIPPVSYYRSYLLRAKTELTGDYIADAGVNADQDPLRRGGWVVTFKMSPEGGRLMGKLTSANIHRRMAIVLDDKVESAPVIQSEITTNGQITLGVARNAQDQLNEANQIALVLRSGALPAPVTIAAESTVGATLGPELVTKGTRAALIGLVAVLLFMIVYYRASGLIADVALVLNGVLVLAVMAMIQTTLTLPGIAGFVLTLGMAVDANVLINERIREEMRAGKTVKVAVQQGYDKVLWTIVDSHVTTLVAGFMLMEFGTGPVRGFAVTLIIGLVASLFTSIIVTRVLMEYFTRRDTARLSV